MKLDNIKFTDRSQPRVSIDFITVDEYAESMKNGSSFPPIEVVYDNENYWMWDGFHRYEAAKKAGLNSFDVNITNGTLQDAEWLCLSANKNHGLHRSNADKQRSVTLALQHPYSNNGKLKSHREIAEHCGVSQPFVSAIVKKITNDNHYHKRNNSQTRHSPTEKIVPEALDLIKNTWIADSQQDIKDLATVKSEDQTEVITLVLDGISNTIKQAKKERKRIAKEKIIEQFDPVPVWDGELYLNTIQICDIYDLALPSESIDMIFTDPPYHDEYIKLYEKLAEIAKFSLKPGAYLMTYVGKIFLPDIMKILNEHLEYVSIFAVFHPFSKSKIQKHNIFENWRPILAYKKPGKTETREWIQDVVRGEREKKYHEWGQDLQAPRQYISAYTKPFDTILDPFVGGGTTPIACKNIGRNFIAFDNDEKRVQVARSRLDGTYIPESR